MRSRPVGEGAPRVLLLGGSNYDLRLKRAFLDTPLVTACDIATYEPRGIGRTAQPDGAWTMHDYAADALAVLDALGWDDACVIGESFGGMTALHLAQLAPERVRAMVLASATAGGEEYASHDISAFLSLPRAVAADEALCLQDRRNVALREVDPDAFAEKLAARIAFETVFAIPSIENGGYARLLEARGQHDCTADIHQITTPALVIAGRYDGQARPEAQRALVDALPNAEFRMFDAGHGVLFAIPQAAQAALTFITDTSRHDPTLTGDMT